MLDKRTIENLSGLHPKVRQMAEQLLHTIETPMAELGVTVVVISGLRSWEAQAALYAQGRTKPGKIVTKAQPGNSWHNYGLAMDLALFDSKTRVYLDEKDPKRADAAYAKIATTAEAQGWEWAGRWKRFCETPHFQFTGGLRSIAEAKERFLAVGMKISDMLAV